MKVISGIFVVLTAYLKQYEIPTPTFPSLFFRTNYPLENCYRTGKGIWG